MSYYLNFNLNKIQRNEDAFNYHLESLLALFYEQSRH